MVVSHSSDLDLSLMALRLLREQLLTHPVAPSESSTLAGRLRALGGEAPLPEATLDTVVRLADETPLRDTLLHADVLALRSSLDDAAGELPDELDHLLAELNSPVLLEGEAPPVRAYRAFHGLARLQCVPLAAAVEALLLARDGFDPRRLPLPPAMEGSVPFDAFVVRRLDRHVELLGEAWESVRQATARLVARDHVRSDCDLSDAARTILDELCAAAGAVAVGRLGALTGGPEVASEALEELARRGWARRCGAGAYELESEGFELGSSEV